MTNASGARARDDGAGGSTQAEWYVRRGRVVRGPFPRPLVERLLRQGRLRPGDEVSPDLRRWAPVGGRPAGSAPAPAGAPTRACDPVRRRYQRERAAGRRCERIHLAALGAALVVLVAVSISLAPGPGAGGPRCDLAPAPAVDWSGCRQGARDLAGADLRAARLRGADLAGAALVGARLRGADLAYAILRRADLGYADLREANLMGADLRDADLSYASLDGADLAYADLGAANLGAASLAGARLDRALWVDGRRCATGSVGRCGTESPGAASP